MVTFFTSVLGGMEVLQGYSMKLQTQMLRVCERLKSFVALSTTVPRLSYVSDLYVAKFCICLFLCSTKVAVCHFWLDDGVAPKDFLSSQLPVPSPHSKFTLLVKMSCLDLLFICILLNFFSCTVEQWGHDRWVFTSPQLVSFGSENALKICVVVRYLLKSSYSIIRGWSLPWNEAKYSIEFSGLTVFFFLFLHLSLLCQVGVRGQVLCLASSCRQICCGPHGWLD